MCLFFHRLVYLQNELWSLIVIFRNIPSINSDSDKYKHSGADGGGGGSGDRREFSIR